MKTVSAVLLGLTSGLFLYFMTTMLIPDGSAVVPAVLGPLCCGWVVSSVFLRRRATSVHAIVRRAFVMWAGEWLLMALLTPVYAVVNTAATIAKLNVRGAAVNDLVAASHRLATKIGVGAFVMAILCSLCYALMTRRNEAPRTQSEGVVVA